PYLSLLFPYTTLFRSRSTPLRRRGDSESGLGTLVRPPFEQPVLDQRDERLGGERHHREDEHRGEDAVRVEGALRGGDEQADSLRSEEHTSELQSRGHL